MVYLKQYRCRYCKAWCLTPEEAKECESRDSIKKAKYPKGIIFYCEEFGRHRNKGEILFAIKSIKQYDLRKFSYEFWALDIENMEIEDMGIECEEVLLSHLCKYNIPDQNDGGFGFMVNFLKERLRKVYFWDGKKPKEWITEKN